MSNFFDSCEKDCLERGERSDEDYENECEQCGQPCRKMFCCKTCYLIGKADYETDQRK